MWYTFKLLGTFCGMMIVACALAMGHSPLIMIMGSIPLLIMTIALIQHIVEVERLREVNK